MLDRLETENLKIIPCTPEILQYAIKGDQALAEHLNISIVENWTEFGTAALQYALEKLSGDNAEIGWWTHFPVHKKVNKLIGSGGYAGKPSAEGVVEIGYEIAPDFRGQGLASEYAAALISNAFSFPQVQTILATTLGEYNPSTSVLIRCGFTKVKEQVDPEHGAIWYWEKKRILSS
ncbi:MAG: GNAT family N-acetyltransferase [Saprospiraceae bacterium]|nr:GNAT family N-acetyltransferase [Saprospiraceae bacterium]